MKVRTEHLEKEAVQFELKEPETKYEYEVMEELNGIQEVFAQEVEKNYRHYVYIYIYICMYVCMYV